MALLPVKWYNNILMAGMPAVTNQFGQLTAFLDAVLVNGFNSKTVTSLTQTGGIATANVGASHGFLVDQVILITGVNETDYQGEFRVLSTTTSNITFAVSPSAPATATGTITCKAAPLNWEIVFTGTNKRVYRSLDPNSPKNMLRVDDSQDPSYTASYAKKAKVTMVEANGMGGIDTFTGAQAPWDSTNPTRNHVAVGSGATVYDGWFKWYYSLYESWTTYNDSNPAENTSTKPITIVGDTRGFYIYIDSTPGYGKSGKCFTDVNSYRANDKYATLLCAQDKWHPANQGYSGGSATYNAIGTGSYYYSNDLFSAFSYTGNAWGKALLKSHTQIGIPVGCTFETFQASVGTVKSGWSTGLPYLNPANLSLNLSKIYLRQSNDNSIRGELPGIMHINNNIGGNMNDNDIITNVTGYPGKKFLIVKFSSINSSNSVSDGMGACYHAFDITGPWW